MNNNHPLFYYDVCVHVGDGESHYVGCTLHDRLGPGYPGDQFDLIIVDYHTGRLELYVNGSPHPFYKGTLRVTAE